MASVVVEFRGLESNQRPPRSERGVATSSYCPGSYSISDPSPCSEVRGGGVEPPSPAPKAGSLPLTDPRECPAGVEPACPGWKPGASPLGQGHGRSPAEGAGVDPSRLIARPFSRRVPSPFGLPFRSQSTGGRNRTCGLLLNREAHGPAHATPVILAVGAAGLEPAFSWSRTRRIARLSHTPSRSSAQRESNPHFRHGKAVGCRYIMGTIADAALSKTESTGWDSNPRRGSTGAVSSPLDHQCLRTIRMGPEGLEPSPARVRAGCAAANTWVPSIESTESAGDETGLPSSRPLRVESGRPDSNRRSQAPRACGLPNFPTP